MTRTRSRFALVLLRASAFGFAQPVAIPQQLTFTPYHANSISDVGKIVGWTVTPGPVAPSYAYKWTIR